MKTEMLRRSIRANIAQMPTDPGPGVAEVERFQEQIEAGRRANRPPDAALSEVDVAFLGQEDRIRALVDERNRLQERVRSLHIALDQERERTGVREVVLAGELRAEQRDTRRACYLAAALFCLLCWREGWGVAVWIWRLL